MKELRNIFLIGYMGSGKSTLGRELAAAIGWVFIDLDKEVENETGKTINALFHEEGEPAFRQVESRVLENIAKSNLQVIASGGGTPLKAENLEEMQRNGVVVYLKVPLEEMIERLIQDRDSRPLLRHRSDDDLAAFIRHHFESRKSAYEKADLIFEAERGAGEMIEMLTNYSR